MIKLQETAQGFALPISGLSVARFLIDWNLDLMFDNDAMLRISTPFSLQLDGIEYKIDPANLGEISPIFELFQQVVTDASASKAGRLTIRFARGHMLEVVPDARFEAWEFTGLSEHLKTMYIVCMASGDLAIWQ